MSIATDLAGRFTLWLVKGILNPVGVLDIFKYVFTPEELNSPEALAEQFAKYMGIDIKSGDFDYPELVRMVGEEEEIIRALLTGEEIDGSNPTVILILGDGPDSGNVGVSLDDAVTRYYNFKLKNAPVQKQENRNQLMPSSDSNDTEGSQNSISDGTVPKSIDDRQDPGIGIGPMKENDAFSKPILEDLEETPSPDDIGTFLQTEEPMNKIMENSSKPFGTPSQSIQDNELYENPLKYEETSLGGFERKTFGETPVYDPIPLQPTIANTELPPLIRRDQQPLVLSEKMYPAMAYKENVYETWPDDAIEVAAKNIRTCHSKSRKVSNCPWTVLMICWTRIISSCRKIRPSKINSSMVFGGKKNTVSCNAPNHPDRRHRP